MPWTLSRRILQQSRDAVAASRGKCIENFGTVLIQTPHPYHWCVRPYDGIRQEGMSLLVYLLTFRASDVIRVRRIEVGASLNQSILRWSRIQHPGSHLVAAMENVHAGSLAARTLACGTQFIRPIYLSWSSVSCGVNSFMDNGAREMATGAMICYVCQVIVILLLDTSNASSSIPINFCLFILSCIYLLSPGVFFSSLVLSN